MTSSGMGNYFRFLRKCHILKPILDAWDLNKSKKSSIYLKDNGLSFLKMYRKNWLSFLIYEISRDKDKRFSLKITKTGDLNVKLLDYPWASEAQ